MGVASDRVTTGGGAQGNCDDAEYSAFLARVSARFRSNVGDGRPVFTTDAGDLWEVYLGTFADPAERQHHNCHACRQFIQRFGSLVTIDEAGRTAPVIWNEEDAHAPQRSAVAALARAVRRAKVMGVFLSPERVWGTPKTGAWHHLSVTPPTSMVYRGRAMTAGQAMAEKVQDFGTVSRGLAEFTPPTIETALTLLRSGALYRSEKVLGAAEWLHKLHAARDGVRGVAKANVVWLAVATAPAGFCHPRSSMIGTLLEDIAAGLPFEDVSRNFAAKMHPLQYQRPQAAPSSGTIAQAERLFETLGLAPALRRRYARADEIEAVWRPAPQREGVPSGGIFGHLKPKGAAELAPMRVPPQTMTWEKFARTVLQTAERIEVLAPARGNYTALVTAVDAEAPPILQWDREDARNPVSWYVYRGGSAASHWGLSGGQFHNVEVVTLKPSMWGGGFEHQGKGVVIVIEGARESWQAGLALFPECLRSDLHGVRSVIEAHSRTGKIEGFGEPHAAGLMLDAGSKTWDATLRVWSGGRSMEYRLDRWD